jgi:hypothetical protein
VSPGVLLRPYLPGPSCQAARFGLGTPVIGPLGAPMFLPTAIGHRRAWLAGLLIRWPLADRFRYPLQVCRISIDDGERNDLWYFIGV